MIRFEPLCLCTNSVPGKDLFHALDLARACGFTYVELAAIDGISEQVNVDLLTDEALGQIRAGLESRGLVCFAVSGHCDMTDPPSFRRLLQKLRFAGAVGARFLNTRCGPPERYDVFLKNVREAAALARELGVTLQLESYGDIVGTASQCGPVFAELEGLQVGYTYDTGNNFRFARGAVDQAADLRSGAVTPTYLHLKDASLLDGWICNEAIGGGQLDIPGILSALEARTPVIPCGLELPTSFRVWAEDLSFDFLSPDDQAVLETIRSSVDYLRRYASFDL